MKKQHVTVVRVIILVCFTVSLMSCGTAKTAGKTAVRATVKGAKTANRVTQSVGKGAAEAVIKK